MSAEKWSQDPATLRALAEEHDASRMYFRDAMLRAKAAAREADELRFLALTETYKMLAQRYRHRAGRIEKAGAK